MYDFHNPSLYKRKAYLRGNFVQALANFFSCPQVRENLMFACKMYGPGMSKIRCENRVDEVVASLGLESCQDTKVNREAETLSRFLADALLLHETTEGSTGN